MGEFDSALVLVNMFVRCINGHMVCKTRTQDWDRCYRYCLCPIHPCLFFFFHSRILMCIFLMIICRRRSRNKLQACTCGLGHWKCQLWIFQSNIGCVLFDKFWRVCILSLLLTAKHFSMDLAGPWRSLLECCTLRLSGQTNLKTKTSWVNLIHMWS